MILLIYHQSVVPSGGESEFYFEFTDPNNQTDHYNLQLINVSAEA